MIQIPRELLQQVAIFGALSEETLDFLLNRAVRLQGEKGRFFFSEGDPANSIYIVESGSVAVIKHWKKQAYLVNNLGPGQCFGEMALMDMHPRSASVQALEDCSVVKIASDDLLALCEQNVEQFMRLQMNLGREVSQRLRNAEHSYFRARMGADPDAGTPTFPLFQVH